MNDFTCQDLVHGMTGRRNMGGIVHKARFLLLAVLLCVLSISLCTTQFAESKVDMFGQSVSIRFKI